jgi:hypothetical protein
VEAKRVSAERLIGRFKRKEWIGAVSLMGWVCGVVAIADGLCSFRRYVHPQTVDACDSEIDGFKYILDASCRSICKTRDKRDDRYCTNTLQK